MVAVVTAAVVVDGTEQTVGLSDSRLTGSPELAEMFRETVAPAACVPGDRKLILCPALLTAYPAVAEADPYVLLEGVKVAVTV